MKNVQKSMVNYMTEGPLFTQMVSFSWPIMVSNFLQTAYMMVSMVIVGQVVGSAGLSGVANGGDLMLLFTFICFGFCSAGQVIIAQFVGRKDLIGVKTTIGTLFSFIMLLAAAFMVVGFLFGDTFLRLINTPEDAFDYARDFYMTSVSGMFFIFGYNLISSIMRGIGDSRHPMLFVAIAAVMNIGLNLLFVAVFKMAAFGSALATVLSQGTSFITSIVFLYRRRESFGFDFKLRSFKMEPHSIGLLMKLGIPMALQMAALSISGLFVNSYINVYGVTISVVTSIGNRIAQVTNVVTGAVSTATSAIVAQNIAARDIKRVTRTVYYCLLIGLAAAVTLSALFFFMPEKIFALFDKNPEVLALAGTYRPVAILNFMGFALRSPFMSLISGIGFAALGLIGGVLDGIVLRVGLALLMGITLQMGVQGFWYGSVLASYAPFAIGIIYFYFGAWKKRKLLVD